MIVLPETIELLIAVATGVFGKIGFDKGRQAFSEGRNGKEKYLTRETHDRECRLILFPITADLTRIAKGMETVESKLDTLSHVTSTAAVAAATSAAAAAAAVAELVERKRSLL